MFIKSPNKNPLINYERKCLIHQKPQNFQGPKISLICMRKCKKNENKLKKKGIKVLPALGEKNLTKRTKENNKKLDWSLDQVVWREKMLKTFWKNKFEHVKNSFLKTLYTVFDWSKNRFDWSKMLRLIQYQSSINRNRQRLTKNF